MSESGMYFIEEDNLFEFSLSEYERFFKEVEMINEAFGVNYFIEGVDNYEEFLEGYEATKNGNWGFDDSGEPITTLFGNFVPALLIAYAKKDGLEIDKKILDIDEDLFYEWIQWESVTPHSFMELYEAIDDPEDGDVSEPLLTIVTNPELLTLAEKFILETEEDLFDTLEVGMVVRLKPIRKARPALLKWKNVRNIEDDLVYASRCGVIEGLYVQELGGMKLVKIKGFGWCIPSEMIEEILG